MTQDELKHLVAEAALAYVPDGAVIGVLGVDHKQTDAFSEDQLQVFEALAGHIAVAIENARLFRCERMQRERMEQEAEEARAVQQALFVKTMPLLPGFAFETAWNPAGAVAGDWFDFIDLGDERIPVRRGGATSKGVEHACAPEAGLKRSVRGV